MRTLCRLRPLTAVLLGFSLLAGCEGASLEPRFGVVPRFGPEPRKDPFTQAAEAAQKTADDVRRAAEASLKELDRELARLRKDAEQQGGDARSDLEARVRRLEEKQRELQRRLDDSAGAGKAALDRIADAIDDAIDEVARAGE